MWSRDDCHVGMIDYMAHMMSFRGGFLKVLEGVLQVGRVRMIYQNGVLCVFRCNLCVFQCFFMFVFLSFFCLFF